MTVYEKTLTGSQIRRLETINFFAIEPGIPYHSNCQSIVFFKVG